MHQLLNFVRETPIQGTGWQVGGKQRRDVLQSLVFDRLAAQTFLQLDILQRQRQLPGDGLKRFRLLIAAPMGEITAEQNRA